MRQIAFAFRMLLKVPFVTTVAVLSLGLGIGANTAIFSLYQQILLRPLPVAAPDELVNLAAPGPKNGSTSCNNAGDCEAVFSYPMFRDLARDQQVFTGIAAHRLFGGNVRHLDSTETTDGMCVSGSYFAVLGVQPSLGRLITPGDDAVVGESPVVVLSHEYWRTRFHQDASILGQTLIVNGVPLTVVGVGPEGFHGTTRGTRAALFVPITLRGRVDAPFAAFEDRTSYWVYLFARLGPGVTVERARAGIDVPYQALLRGVELPLQPPSSDDQRAQFLARRVTVEDGRRGQSYVLSTAGTPLAVLQAVTSVVLLIACANIANLLLARAAGRAGEMAVRLSVGASRGQLVRQLLVESCLLAALGGAAGLLLMRWTIGVLSAQLPIAGADDIETGLTTAVLLVAAGLSLATGVLFGLFPALHATRPDLASVLKGQAGQPSGARSAARFRNGLVVVQIALSMGLLASAGLFAKSLLHVSRVDLGVEIDHVMTFYLNPVRNGGTPARARQVFEEIESRLAAVPGVTGVSAARVPLIANSNSSSSITVEGYTAAEGERTSTNYNDISPDYFRTVGVPLLAGRDFTTSDTLSSPKVAIVNEAFARRFNLGANPVGRRMRRGGGSSAPLDIEIVGLVRDAKYSRVRDAVPPVYFLPYRQNELIGALSFYVRTAGDPDAAFAAVRSLVASVDATLPVQRLRTMRDQVAENVAGDRLLSVLSASFAGLATALASIGLYGVLAYTVSQRTREFGLRMALGAAPSVVQRLVLRQVVWMTIAGGAVGLVLAVVTGRLADTLLFEMSGSDPIVLIASAAALTIVALAAGVVPSIRASRVDPMQALRSD
jgi:predicted permease